MDKYIKFIRDLKPFKDVFYKNVSSMEKLIVYAMYFLETENISLSFNYVCIAAYKLFPERFHFGDFKEYPHIEMLNRTLLHLRPKERNYAVGDGKKSFFKLTQLGYQVAGEVEKELKIKNVKNKTRQVKIDSVKITPKKDLEEIKKNKTYNFWKESKIINESDLWNFFDVIPYTRIKYIKNRILELKKFARDYNEKIIYEFLSDLEKNQNLKI